MSSIDTLEAEFAIDEQALRQKTPYPLIPTNLKGAYASPAPADSFDPNKASATDLLRQGLLWRRPAAGDDTRLVKAWEKVFSRKWLAKDRIVPHLEPQIGKTHLLRKTPRKVSEQNYLNSAWAGAGTRGGQWTSVVGNWYVPTVSKPPETQGLEGGWNSSSWIGIDGFDIGIVSDDVLQVGVQQRVNANGQASYIAWYEWFAPQQPNSPPYIWQTNITNFMVNAGNEVNASVQYANKNTAGYIYFANLTTGQHFSITLAPPPGATFKGNTVEWIMEAPDGGEPQSSLPKFTPVIFTSALACGPNNTFTNPQTGDTVNIENTSNKVLTSVAIGSDTATIDFIG